MKYDYRCVSCNKKFELEVVGMLRIEKKRPVSPECPYCKSKDVKKLISVSALQFKGSAKGGGLK